ncbi:hypothetical protein ACYSNU_04905 [Enterococcus sp. LJL120]
MTEIEVTNARIFFTGLKQLTEEDRKVLADKYYYSTNLCSFDAKRDVYQTVAPVNDVELSHKYGLPLHQFRTKRIEAEENLASAMKRILRQGYDNLQTFCLQLSGKLFFSRIPSQKRFMYQKEFVVTSEESLAKVFHSFDEDSLVLQLLSFGFKKVPVSEKNKNNHKESYDENIKSN